MLFLASPYYFFLSFLRPMLLSYRNQLVYLLRDHSFSTYAKCSEKLTFPTSYYAQVRAYLGVRNVRLSEFCVRTKWNDLTQINPFAANVPVLNHLQTFALNGFIGRKLPRNIDACNNISQIATETFKVQCKK